MHWSDDGIVLSVRRHGETSAVVTLLTRRHGRHAGLVRGGAGRRLRGILQPGNEVSAEWRARLAEHLGTFAVEPGRARVAELLDDPARLAALAAACAVTEASLPEREPHPALFDALRVLLDSLADGETWPAVYVRWEMGLLQELGFGLDLSRCAATGDVDDLAYVSPKSGRAVSRAAAEPYKHRLLPLPAFLLGAQTGLPDGTDVKNGLALTGYFLDRHIFAGRNTTAPPARHRLVEKFSVAPTISGDNVPA